MESGTGNDRDYDFRAEIRELLAEVSTPGTRLNGWRRSPGMIYPDFRDILHKYRLPVLTQEQFCFMLKRFVKNQKKDERAAARFIASISNKTKRITIARHSLKGKKRVRGEDYKDLLQVHIMSKAATTAHFGDVSLEELIREKSYRLEKYEFETEGSCSYMSECAGVPVEDMKLDAELSPSAINMHAVMYCIKYFRKALDYHVKCLFEKYPAYVQADIKRWLVDVFKDRSVRFLPDWKAYQRKSPNRPQFGKSYEKLISFMNGRTSKDLGYSSKTFHQFAYRVKPQGTIWLLYGIYWLLYGRIDRERQQLRDKAARIRKVLDDMPRSRAMQILEQLQSEYAPPGLASYKYTRLKDPRF